MKLIKASCKPVMQQKGIIGMYKQIELGARTCYTEDTEVLTDCGWQKISTLTKESKVLTYNPEQNTLVYDDANLIINEVSEKLIKVDHPFIKMCVTGNHRIYQSPAEKREYSFITANQMAGIEPIPHSHQNRFRIAKYFINSHKDIKETYPKVIEYSIEPSKYHPDFENSIKLPVNKDLMVILGAYIAEGNTNYGEKHRCGSNCQITQDENSILYKDVITSLNNLNIHYRVHQDPRKPNIKWIIFGNRTYAQLFDELCGKGSHNKHFPCWFRTLPDEYLETLIKYLYLGDGSHSTTRHESYISASLKLLEDLQEAFILLGKNASIRYKKINGAYSLEESLRDSWIVSRKKHVSLTEVYTGKVYCTSTTTGIICIRVNGQVCWCGNCYKSEDKVTDDSYKKFIEMLESNKHAAPLAHGSVYLKMTSEEYVMYFERHRIKGRKLRHFYNPMWTRVTEINDEMYVSTNYRVIKELHMEELMQYWCEPTEHHVKRISVMFEASRGIMDELRTHATSLTVNAESTRWCTYNKKKFNGELTFIEPSWWNDVSEDARTTIYNFLARDEWTYMHLLEDGLKAQQARIVLPLDLKSTFMATGFVDSWEAVIEQRTAKNVLPDMILLMEDLRKQLIDNKLING